MRRTRKSRFLALILMAAMLLTQIGVIPAAADSVKVVTLGADLSEDQKASIMQFFGVTPNEVQIIYITNEDERAQLSAFVPLEKIGTHTYSCAMVNPTSAGGIQVKTANMNYVTSNMIASTLSTSGVINCDVLTAAPFEVSGTGALTGVMMAYETASGETLSEEKKTLAVEEQTITSQVGETIGQDEATMVVNDIKIHIIRDEVKDEQQVVQVVDEVVETTHQAAADLAMSIGAPEPARPTQADYENLHSFGIKISRMDYNYEEMQPTLERVTNNVVVSTGIQDPITESFDVKPGEESLDADSILNDTDDSALGDDVEINSTGETIVMGDAQTAELGKTAAGVKLKRVAKVSVDKYYPDFVSGTSLLRREDSNGNYALQDLEGNVLTDYAYTYSFEFINGAYVEASLNTDSMNRKGILDTNGQVLVPFQYSEIEEYDLNKHWAIGIVLTPATEDDYDYYTLVGDTEYFQIQTADIYHISDGSASLVASLTRDQYAEVRAYGDYINIQDRTGTAALYDSSFTPVAEGLYSTYDTGNVLVSNYEVFHDDNYSYGVRDRAGNVIIAPSFDSIEDRTVDYGYFVVCREENGDYLYGLYNQAGVEVLPPVFERISSNDWYAPSSGAEGRTDRYSAYGYFAVEQGGTYRFAVYGGNVTNDTGFSTDDYSYTSYGAAGTYKDDQEQVHLFAGDGNQTVLGSEYSYVRAVNYSSGMFWYATNESSRMTDLLDWHGDVLISGKKSFSISGDGRYMLAADGSSMADLYEVYYEGIDEEADAQAEKVADALEQTQTPAAEQAAVPARTSGTITGVSLAPAGDISSDPYYASFISGTSLLTYRGNSGYGIMNLDGEVLSDTAYASSFTFINNAYLKASKNTDELNNIGILGLDGAELIPFTYGVVEEYGFNEHWAVGIVLTDATEDDYDYYTLSGDKTYFYIDTVDIYHIENGSAQKVATLTRDQYADARAYDDYINIQSRDTGEAALYDASFNVVESGLYSAYDSGSLYSSGLETYYGEDGKRGLKDASGNVVLEAKYDSISTGNLCYGYLDTGITDKSTGESVYYDGLADMQGHDILPPVFDRIYSIDYNPVQAANDPYCAYGYYSVLTGGMHAFAVDGGEVTCLTDIPEGDYSYYNYGVSAVYENEDGSFRLFAADGVETSIAGQYKYLRGMDYSAGALLIGTDEDYNVDLLDWHGEPLLTGMDSISLSGDGRYILARDNDGGIHLYEVTYLGITAPDEGAADNTGAAQAETQAETQTETQPAQPETQAETQPAQPETQADSPFHITAETEAPQEETTAVLFENAETGIKIEQTGDAWYTASQDDSGYTTFQNRDSGQKIVYYLQDLYTSVNSGGTTYTSEYLDDYADNEANMAGMLGVDASTVHQFPCGSCNYYRNDVTGGASPYYIVKNGYVHAFTFTNADGSEAADLPASFLGGISYSAVTRG